MNKIIISTVGTSILTNACRGDIDFKSIYDKHILNKEEINKEYAFKVIERHINLAKDKENISAEIKSILKIGIEDGDYLYFISTETEDCLIAAELIEKFFKSNYKCEVKNEIIKGLQVEDPKKFKNQGVKNLFEKIIDIIDRHPYMEIILNPTGGFKSVVPYITILGMIYQKEIKYVFERTESLLTLPPIPLKFNFDLIKKCENKFKKIYEEGAIPSGQFYEGMSIKTQQDYRPFLIENRGYITLSELGEVFYRRYVELYSKQYIKMSDSAVKVYNNLYGEEKDDVHQELKKLLDPKLRIVYLHDKMSEVKTDCKVFKIPDTSERIFYFMKENMPMICEVLTSHDKYEMKLDKMGVFKKNYDNFHEIEI